MIMVSISAATERVRVMLWGVCSVDCSFENTPLLTSLLESFLHLLGDTAGFHLFELV